MLFRTLMLAAVSLNAMAQPPAAGLDQLSRAAKDQVAQVAAATERYRDASLLQKEGWKRFGGDEPLMGEHWSHPAGPDYVAGKPIDFTRPSNLMYTQIGGKKVLVGVAFVVRLDADDPLPPGFDGAHDHWHVHDIDKALKAALDERPVLGWLANAWLDANYRSKGDNRSRLAMAHTWVTIPNPDDMFANYHRVLPYLKLGLPAAYANGASEASARGLHLATANGCADTLDGALWIANVSGSQTRTLRAACSKAAKTIKAELGARDAARINALAARQWADWQAVWNRQLTPEQRARIDAMTDHSGHDAAATDAEHRHH